MCRVVADATAPGYGVINLQTVLIVGSEDESASLEGCMRICDGIIFCRMEAPEVVEVEWRICECDAEGSCVNGGE